MELQNKFLNIHSIAGGIGMSEKQAKACTELCLEEQEKLLARLGSNELSLIHIFKELDRVRNQLKELENGN